LSKASHSDELVARINHTSLSLDLSFIPLLGLYYHSDYGLLNKALKTLIKGVGDYLMRVVGSVPIGFHLTGVTAESDGERQFFYYYHADITGERQSSHRSGGREELT
jgi:hypothetical protein